MAHNVRGYAQLGLELCLPAWPVKSVFLKAKIQMFSRITNVDWPSSFAQLRITDVVRQAALRSEPKYRLERIKS